MVYRRLYEIIGLVCGFVLIDYGFSFLASGFPGAHASTSQSVSVSLLVAGSATVFISLYYLLKPVSASVSSSLRPVTSTPGVGVELISDEKDIGSHYGLYRTVEYIGYFFTGLGIFSAADLTLQVFIPSIYNETRWWIEILLVTFGVLSYAIFVSIGRLGAQEEPHIMQPTPHTTPPAPVAATEETKTAPPSYVDLLEVRMSAFAKSGTKEYERRLADDIYDVLRIETGGVTVWREDRRGLRSVYLGGPYELNWTRLKEALDHGEEIRIGSLFLPLETIRDFVAFHDRPAEGISSQAAS